ncbi:MAG: DUF2752 domain-containing protein [Phycisphaerales bacterium]
MERVKERLISGATAAGCLALLVVAARMEASPEGHGTHEQLGLPACAWPGLFDAPCPTCGMTTAFAHSADLRFGAAFLTQPMGAILAVVTAVVFWLALHSALTGSRALSASGRALSGKGTAVAIGLLLGSWVFKIATWDG